MHPTKRKALYASLALAGAWPLVGQEAAPAPAAATPAATSEEEIIVLSPFEVTTESDTGYVATDTLAGTRIRTELKDVGSAISVVTKEMLTDIGATDSATLLQYTTNTEVGGVRSTYAGLGNGSSVEELGTLRSPGGYENRVRGLSKADNVRDYFVTDIPWDGYITDRVDIQRGPNSILFGLGKPGGMVNASMDSAMFANKGELSFRFGSYGSARTNLDVNQQIVDDVLAIRVEGLWDHEKYRQDPAFENDERIYTSLRWDPKIFGRNNRTTIKFNYEHGDIEANRPRTVPPNDHISAWFRDTTVSATNPFGGMGRLLVGSGYDAEREDTPPIAGDGKGLTRTADPDYNPWVQAYANQQTPIYFMDGTTGELQQIYGGYVNPGALNSNGTLRNLSDGLEGKRYSGIFYGVAGLDYYARQAKLPGYQYGQYREQTLTDSSVFDFYNKLIDGDNKREWENWDAYNLNLTQTFLDDRIGVQLVFDEQRYRNGGESLLGYGHAISLDITQYNQDLTENENLLRPFIAASGGSGSSYRSKREAFRGQLFGEFRTSDVTSNEFLIRLLGRHRLTGVYSKESYFSENRTWQLYRTSDSWDSYNGMNLPITDRPPYAVIYLGDAISPTASSASGMDLSNVASRITLGDGKIYVFDSTWNAPSSVSPSDLWTIPSTYADIYTTSWTSHAPMQNSNPDNYVGWNNNYSVDILTKEGGDDLTVTASKVKRTVTSYSGTLQNYWWDGAIVSTIGWRFDDVVGRDVTAPTSLSRKRPNLDPEVYNYYGSEKAQYTNVKEHSLSWGTVVHLNRFLRHDPLPINISLSYNTSDNFEVTGIRRDMMGNVLANPNGKTKDWGVLLSTKDGKYTFRAVKYEASAQNASTSMSNINGLGDIVAYGLRWANVFEYNIGSGYTMANAGSTNGRTYFDRDYASGQTAEEAAALEASSIAAWRTIQSHMPQSFYSYWGWDPTVPDAYPVGYANTPQGLTVTSDTKSKGYEFELTANITPSWRLAVNASKTSASYNNVGGTIMNDFVDYMSEMIAGPAGDMRMYWGNYGAATLRQQWNSWLGNYTLLKLTEGSDTPELRKWRFNIMTNYSFRSGKLKGLGLGGSYRWQDKQVLGYPVVAIDSSTFTYDLTQPHHGPSEDAVDVWVSYERKLTAKINWKIQLNVRNLFAEDGLIPMSVQSDGKTWASARIAPAREWMITNTFSF